MREDPGNYKAVSLTSVLVKNMGEIILGVTKRCLKNSSVIRHRQHGFRNSCLANLMSFYEKITLLVEEGKMVDVVFLDFTKAFYAIPHIILKCSSYSIPYFHFCQSSFFCVQQEDCVFEVPFACIFLHLAIVVT